MELDRDKTITSVSCEAFPAFSGFPSLKKLKNPQTSLNKKMIQAKFVHGLYVLSIDKLCAEIIGVRRVVEKCKSIKFSHFWHVLAILAVLPTPTFKKFPWKR